MKNIGFVTLASDSNHQSRGIGFYVNNLLPELIAQAKKNNINIVEIRHSYEIIQGKFDVIHYPYLDIFDSTLPIRKSAPTVVTIHDLIPLEYSNVYKTGIKAKLNYFHQYISLKNVNLVLTDSNYSANSINKYFNIPNQKIKLIYLAASNNFFKQLNSKKLLEITKKYNLPKKFILYVGDLNFTKNVNLLIKACIDLKTPLVLVGKAWGEISNLNINHPELKHISSIKSDLKSPLVHNLGFVSSDDLPSIYHLSTIYCQPSLAEGFGMPVLEAMACKTAVVTSTAEAITEISGLKLAKFQFDAKNIEDIKTKLSLVFNSDKLRQENISICVDQVSNFSWSKTAEETIRAYKTLI